MSKKEKAIVEAKDYSLMEMNAEHLTEVLSQNIGDGGLSRFDLDTVKVPSGGATTWEIPTLEGEDKSEEITGILVFWKDVRAYWEAEYDGSSNPPDCYSDDMKIGVGEPGGKCSECPFAEFGSADKGEGQACKQIRILFMIRKDDILPLTIPAPPTSVGPIKKYFMRLASKGIPYYSIITKLSLEKATNANGIKYSKIKPDFVEKLNKKTTQRIKEYQESIEPMLTEVQIETLNPDDIEVEE